MQILNKDLTTVREGVIGHQVNCRGKMGAGTALAIRRAFPKAYREYMKAFYDNKLVLGNIVLVGISEKPPLFVAHLCGQFNYGRHGKFTDEKALRTALEKTMNFINDYEIVYKIRLQLYLPHGIGCNLAGGDWAVVSKIIEETAPETILCKI